MSRIEHMLAAWRPHREAWLANARRLITGKPVGTTSHGLSAKTVISAISAPLACIVAGAALASVATSDDVDDVWTRVTAQSFIPVDAKDIDPDQFYVRQVGLSQLDLENKLNGEFASDPGKLREELTCLARKRSRDPRVPARKCLDVVPLACGAGLLGGQLETDRFESLIRLARVASRIRRSAVR